jgi:hypothetical protein
MPSTSFLRFDKFQLEGSAPVSGSTPITLNFTKYTNYASSIFEVRKRLFGFYGTGSPNLSSVKRTVIYTIDYNGTGFQFTTITNGGNHNPNWNIDANDADDLHNTNSSSVLVPAPSGLSSVITTVHNQDATHIFYFTLVTEVTQLQFIP